MENIQLLQQLIRIPSPSGKEKILADFILKYLQKNNIPGQRKDGNVIVLLKGKDRSKALIFNAHLDTVSAGNIKSWKYAPFGEKSGKLSGNKVYGLGASDDKAAIASMLLLAKTLYNPPIDVWFTFVASEEVDGTGTASFLDWFKKSKNLSGYSKIAAVIGEPTNLESIEIGHRGNAFITLTTKGVTGHGAEKYAVNDLAVEMMLKALGFLKKAFAGWKKSYSHKILGEPAYNITEISASGGSLNKIPDRCTASLDIRTTPELHPKLDKLLEDILGNDVSIRRIKGHDMPGLTSEKSDICRLCKKLFPELPFTVSLGATDFSQFVKSGIDTVIIGPGNKHLVHKPDEYAQVNKIDEAVEIYKKIIKAF